MLQRRVRSATVQALGLDTAHLVVDAVLLPADGRRAWTRRTRARTLGTQVQARLLVIRHWRCIEFGPGRAEGVIVRGTTS